ncbi:hypothetical protein GIB67_001242 [Kingdonia uniflora]|uniref:Uncharacterized protein n=1 Tax=Kingdonia uniflora TaxID=39325 RepID=A0A7J7LGM4_9MAGN|nr:hypothetical protein GIB67_001242 [Kingdonia uniflora]
MLSPQRPSSPQTASTATTQPQPLLQPGSTQSEPENSAGVAAAAHQQHQQRGDLADNTHWVAAGAGAGAGAGNGARVQAGRKLPGAESGLTQLALVALGVAIDRRECNLVDNKGNGVVGIGDKSSKIDHTSDRKLARHRRVAAMRNLVVVAVVVVVVVVVLVGVVGIVAGVVEVVVVVLLGEMRDP